jgi:hypothetical protein
VGHLTPGLCSQTHDQAITKMPPKKKKQPLPPVVVSAREQVVEVSRWTESDVVAVNGMGPAGCANDRFRLFMQNQIEKIWLDYQRQQAPGQVEQVVDYHRAICQITQDHGKKIVDQWRELNPGTRLVKKIVIDVGKDEGVDKVLNYQYDLLKKKRPGSEGSADAEAPAKKKRTKKRSKKERIGSPSGVQPQGEGMGTAAVDHETLGPSDPLKASNQQSALEASKGKSARTRKRKTMSCQQAKECQAPICHPSVRNDSAKLTEQGPSRRQDMEPGHHSDTGGEEGTQKGSISREPAEGRGIALDNPHPSSAE